jgi:hypothetical protein
MMWDSDVGWFGLWSVVVQLTDGNFTDLGSFLDEDLWNSDLGGAAITERLIHYLDNVKPHRRAHLITKARCGSICMFPAGVFFVCFFFLPMYV